MARIIQTYTKKLPEDYELDVELVQAGTKKEVRIRIYRVNYGPFGIKLARHRVNNWIRKEGVNFDGPFEDLVRREIRQALNIVAKRIQTEEELADMEISIE